MGRPTTKMLNNISDNVAQRCRKKFDSYTVGQILLRILVITATLYTDGIKIKLM